MNWSPLKKTCLFVFFHKHSYCTENFYPTSSFIIAGDVEILPYFYGPVGVLLLINLTLFAATARELTCGLWKREVVKSNTERYRTALDAFLRNMSAQCVCCWILCMPFFCSQNELFW